MTSVTHCAELTPLTELVDGVGTPDRALVERNFCKLIPPPQVTLWTKWSHIVVGTIAAVHGGV